MAPEQQEGREATTRTYVLRARSRPVRNVHGQARAHHRTARSLGGRPADRRTARPAIDAHTRDGSRNRTRNHALSRARSGARRPSSAIAVAAALPGGDPLAAALAAGETPSPELVAAGENRHAIARRSAPSVSRGYWPGLLALAPLARRRQPDRVDEDQRSPQALTERAHRRAAETGLCGTPADQRSGTRPMSIT